MHGGGRTTPSHFKEKVNMKQDSEIGYSKEQALDGKFYCRKCMSFRPERLFYKAVDKHLVDTNGRISVCKECAQDIYNELYEKVPSMEKVLHIMCTTLNVKFSNEAIDATKAHIDTLLAKGNNVSAVFSIFLMKLVATNPTMDKSAEVDMTYSDIGTIFTDKQFDIKEAPLPQEVLNRWGADLPSSDIKFLENEYVNFKKTHKADTYAEVVLLKQVCFMLLDIERTRRSGEDVNKMVAGLQALMRSLDIAPNISNANSGNTSDEAFGLWLQDIERFEPAEWLKSDPRGDMYRDVANVEDLFQKYLVRPLKNFITQSKDFSIEDAGDTFDLVNEEEGSHGEEN